MFLQVAVDLVSLPQAVAMLQKVAPNVDIIEVGTPFIKQEGLGAVSIIKSLYGDKKILADMKTMDAGQLEAQLAFDAGADYMTVLSVAADATIAGAVGVARQKQRAVIADMIGSPDPLARALELEALGVNGVEVHCGLDQQAQGHCSWETAKEIIRRLKIPVSIAGGINPGSVLSVAEMGAAVAVMGAAIYGAVDPGAAAREARARIETMAATVSR